MRYILSLVTCGIVSFLIVSQGNTFMILTWLGLALLLGAIALIRNEWVYHQRVKLINADINPDDDYLDYYEMMHPRMWLIWDIEKMRKKVLVGAVKN